MTRRPIGRRGMGLGVALAACLTLSGCGLGRGLYGIPLPGGASLGDHPYSVTAKFTNALDLVPQSGVRVNDVPVGRVTSLSLEADGRVADVHLEVNGSVQLPANAVASIQQTSLLGEKYVALSSPLGVPSTGRLRNHAVIPLTRTSDGVEVEQVLGALSLLLNGGGVGELHTITHELNLATGGRTDKIRGFLTSTDAVVRQLNAHRDSITHALDALATLSGTLRTQNARIRSVLAGLAPGISVIADQRKQVNAAIDALAHLGTVTVQTLDASSDDIVADLKNLGPILTQLIDAGSALPQSLKVLLTYPFPTDALAGIKGDYLNGYLSLQLRTPGGRVYQALSTPARLPSSGPKQQPAPPSLLPATSSAGQGLPSTLVISSASTTATSAASATSATTVAGAKTKQGGR